MFGIARKSCLDFACRSSSCSLIAGAKTKAGQLKAALNRPEIFPFLKSFKNLRDQLILKIVLGMANEFRKTQMKPSNAASRDNAYAAMKNS